MGVHYLNLARQWGDALLKLQIRQIEDPALDGGILCPACKHIHGRGPDAVYGLMALADYTGEERYLEGARALFRWQENLLCDDGTLYNDANNAWNGTTVFAIISLHEALVHHGHLLRKEEREDWENRMLSMSRWVAQTIVPGYVNNINYLAGGAAVQALLSQYFHLPEYAENARLLADYVMAHFTENGLLCGEGIPHDRITGRGCRPVDIGYNAEESVGLMIRYALALDDQAALNRLTEILRQQLEFMMPDGSWDNSFGTRCNKWTYWGSRTSDGCQVGYALLAERDPLFVETIGRNTELMARCTANGLLHGGPEYEKYGELPCVHHTFTHINALAAVLDAGIKSYESKVWLPADRPQTAVRYFPEIDTYKLAFQKWRATVTGYDFWLDRGHASGGTMTMLWHEDAGPVLLSSVVDYRMAEPLNMQLPLKKKRHRPLTPRLEKMTESGRYSSCYDTDAKIEVNEAGDGIHVHVSARLVSREQEELSEPVCCQTEYWLHKDGLSIRIQIAGPGENVRLVLPVIADEAKVTASSVLSEPESIFYLTSGFGAREFIILPDGENRIWAEIVLQAESNTIA